MRSRASSNHSKSERPVAVLALLFVVLPGVACKTPPDSAPTPAARRSIGDVMPGKKPTLAGKWEKLSTEPCSRKYPARIEFQDRRLYAGTADTPGEFTWWDAGTWELSGEGQVKLSTATDAVIAYKYSISANVVTFTDPDGCEFKYRKIQ